MSTNARRIGKYELQQHLGQGGMGEVWKAFDVQLHRYVAIKLLHADLQNDPEFISRFEREARMIASLNHPNIVQVHDFQVSRGGTGSVGSSTVAYMVMDYIEGPSLAEYIGHTSRVGNFPPAADIVHLFASISAAVDYAHQRGMIHRDIKPSNILLDKRGAEAKRQVGVSVPGEPVLTDFGIAKLLATSTGSSSGSWHGTELYIAPEQAQGYVGNERSDLYSLGIILYEICTGRLPFQSDNPTEIMMQHINQMPPAPASINPHIPPALSAVILRSIAKDPSARFPSAASMAIALAEALEVPIPENLDLPGDAVDAMSEPTFYKPRQADMTSSSPASLADLEIVKTSTPPPATLVSGGGRFASAGSVPHPGMSPPLQSTSPEVIPSSIAAVGANSSAGQTLPTGETIPRTASDQGLPQASSPPSPPRISQRRPGRGLLIALLLLVLLVLIGSGVGAFFFLHRNAFTGHAYFVSSPQGTDDELLIDLHNVPDAGSGKSYYAWLLSDASNRPVNSLLLGALHVNNGAVHVIYQNALHINLLGMYSRFVITEEDTNGKPSQPLSDQQAWRYYAELPQAPNPGNHLSMLGSLRYLLADNPAIKGAGLSGGFNSWLFKNTGKILEFAGTARDYYGDPTSINLMQQHFFRILILLDGEASAQKDLPPNTSPSAVIRAPIALLGFDPNDLSSFGASYLGEVRASLSMLAQAPGTTPDIIQHANQINAAINNIKTWLGQVQTDARKLVKMTPAQLLLPSSRSILDDMQTQAFYAYVGQIDPSTNKVEEGVTQIHYDIEQLATFDITPYTSS